jgi:condensin-2 complex subunit H2
MSNDKYKGLIQPLRELAQSFDVDISEGLCEYLEALEQLDLVETNFAEAALVIQGSAVAFGKKVDFLHQLVFETLEFLVSTSGSTKERDSTARESTASASTGRTKEDDCTDFHSFESSILLDELVSTRYFKNPSNVYLPRQTRKAASAPDRRRTSLSAETTLRSAEHTHNSTVVMHSIMEAGKLSVKLNHSTIDENTGGLSIIPQEGSRRASLFSTGNNNLTRHSHSFIDPVVADETVADTDEFDDGWNEDEGDAAAVPAPASAHQSTRKSRSPRNLADLSFSPIRENSILSHRHPEPPLLPAKWQQQHDPHEVHGKPRPLRPGKTYVLPDRAALTTSSQPSKGPLKLFNAAAFGYLLEQRLQAEKAARRPVAIRQPLYADHQHSIFDDFDEELDEENAQYAGDVHRDDLAPFEAVAEADATNPLFDFEEDFSSGGVPASPLQPTKSMGADIDGSDLTVAYEAACSAHLEAFLREAQEFARDTHMSARVKQWTQRLEPILRSEEIAPIFDISSYCKNTVGFIKTSMKTRCSPSAKDTINFSSIVCGESAVEVSRVFLSCLQLINAGMLDVADSKTGEFSLRLVGEVC